MQVNKEGADWIALRMLIDDRIEMLRNGLEQPDANEWTNMKRGQIMALRWLIDEVETPPSTTPTTPEETYD